MRILLSALALSLLSLSPAPQQPKRHPILYWTMRQEDIDKLVRHVPQEDAIRLAQLHQTFHDLQCNPPELREQKTPSGTNILCSVPGETPETIVIAAHYQHVGSGESAVGDWSGSMMVPFLFHALMAQPRRHSYVFIAFDGEEGAKAWMHSLTKVERRNLKMMVALDALGMNEPAFYLHPADKYSSPEEWGLISALQSAARDSQIPELESRLPAHWFRTDDTKQFRYLGVPSVVIYSQAADHGSLPGSANDTVLAIDSNSYYDVYRLLCTFVTELDEAPMPDDTDRSPHSLGLPR